jgi:hypothetical protein
MTLLPNANKVSEPIIVSKNKAQMDNSSKITSVLRPWPGLASYSIHDSEYFLGRSKEITELTERVINEPLNCVFGPSGVGKSSLLQAGLGNNVQKYDFFPVFIRLDHQNNTSNYIQQTIDKVIEMVCLEEFEIEEIVQSVSGNKQESLWEFFHRHIFWNKRNHLVKPLLIFDQFEEIFTLAYTQANARNFINELGELAENTVPEKIQDFLRESNTKLSIPAHTIDYRIIISLREDFLAQLEMLTGNIPAFRRNRYAIRALNGEQALEVINIPGEGIVDNEVAEVIINTISIAANKSGDVIPLAERVIEPAILSLFCRELNEQRIVGQKEKITVEQVKNSGGNIIYDFYLNSTGSVSTGTKEFIEDKLLTESGYRNPVALEDILASKIEKSDIDNLINLRLLRIEDRQGILWVEFSHDILTKEAYESRNNRRSEQELAREKKVSEELIFEQRKQKRKYRILRIFIAAVLMFILVIGYGEYFFFFKLHEDKYAKITKCNGFFEGRRALTDKEASYLNCYYKLTREGVYNSFNDLLKRKKKPYNKIYALNGYGNLTTNHTIGTYLINQWDDEDTIGVEPEAKEELGKVCQWEFIADARGQIACEKAYDKDLHVIYSFIYTARFDTGSVKQVVGQYSDEWGLPWEQRKNDADHIRITYDENGYERLIEYFDEQGNPKPNSNGAYAEKNKYNEYGMTIYNASLNEFGDLMIDSAGNTGMRFIYDKNFNQIKAISFGTDEKIKKVKDQYAVVKFTYDNYGNVLSSFYFDEKEKPCLANGAYHGVINRVNQHGQETERKWVGLKGELVPISKDNPVAMEKIEHDNKGNDVLWQFFDKQGKQDGLGRQYAKQEFSYNDSSELVYNTKYRFKDGSLKLWYKYQAFKDEKNRDTLTYWYDMEDAISTTLYLRKRYDRHDRQIFKATYNEKKQPINYFKFDTIKYYKYDTKIVPGDTITYITRHYYANGELIDGTAIEEDKYLNDKLISSVQFDKDYDYLLGTLWEYDDNSNEISRYAIGISGIPFRGKSSGAHFYKAKYVKTIKGENYGYGAYNEFKEPSVFLFSSNSSCHEIMNGIMFDLNGDKIEESGTFEKSLYRVFQINLTSRQGFAYKYGIQDGDIIISCGNWKYKPNEEYKALKNELIRLKESKKSVLVARYFPKEGRLKLLHFNLPVGMFGINVIPVYYTPKEYERLKKLIEK